MDQNTSLDGDNIDQLDHLVGGPRASLNYDLIVFNIILNLRILSMSQVKNSMWQVSKLVNQTRQGQVSTMTRLVNKSKSCKMLQSHYIHKNLNNIYLIQNHSFSPFSHHHYLDQLVQKWLHQVDRISAIQSSFKFQISPVYGEPHYITCAQWVLNTILV